MVSDKDFATEIIKEYIKMILALFFGGGVVGGGNALFILLFNLPFPNSVHEYKVAYARAPTNVRAILCC